jgi:2-keto-4-pentenoate hydratase/2-oxohepta-3-ene-1,7-dioic acid hydratase in catechol pathway
MKLCFFNDWRLGVVKGDAIVDVTDLVQAIPHICPGTLMNGLIADFGSYRAKLEAATGPTVPLAGAKLLPPVPKPGQIDCMAANYMESGTLPAPPAINGFHKSPSAIIGTGGTMVLSDIPASIFEGEAEMAVVIGKKARNVAPADAMGYVFGYINFIDGSARGLPPAGNVFFQMKSRETYAPIGPFLVTADEIADPHDLDIVLTVNGVVKQSFNTSDMAHKIPRCIEWASAMHTLNPGDILATGTNHRGLSAFQDGDVVELETEGLGRLTFHVQDDLKRTWGRMTRLERAEAGFKDPEPQLTGKYAV